MAQAVRPLDHPDPDRKTDETLRSEARAHLSATPSLQLAAELYTRLRVLELPWWTPEMLRERWSATERMRWYRARPDLRQRITTALTGLAPKAARKKAPDFQGALLDSVIDEGDVAPRSFEEAFDPCDLVVYGPVEAFWGAFVEKMPWGQDTPVHQELVAWLFDALLADHSSIDGMIRKPILSAWDARTSIDGRVWHTRMPLEIRVAIDEARFKKERERPGEPFHAESDLSIAVSATIATSIPLRDLAPVFATAERAMGFSPPPRPGPQPEPKRIEPAFAAAPVPEAAPAVKPAAAPAPRGDATPPAAAAARPEPRPSVPPPAAPMPSTPPPMAIPSAPPPMPMPSAPPPAMAMPSASPPAAPSPPHSGPRAVSTPPPPLSTSRRSDFPPAAAPPGPVAQPARREPAPPPAAPSRTEAARPDPKAAPDSKAALPSPRAVANTLLDALDDLPVEEDRTNPWDVPSSDSTDGDDTSTFRRDDVAAHAKRKRQGKG